METPSPYPIQLTGELGPHLSRGLWLVKWLLAIPHFVVLVFLWVGFVLVSIVAFFAISGGPSSGSSTTSPGTQP